MTERLKDLVDIACHSGLDVLAFSWVHLPVHEYKTTVWATEPIDPLQLDEIFFKLLQNGVTTREQLAECLGIDDDSFIFTHLDILVREGYVEETEDGYSLTNHGKEFLDGTVKEEALQSEEFSFFWEDVRESVIAKPSKPQKRDENKEPVKRIEHKCGIPDDKLLSKLAKSFNKEKHEQSLEYYSINESERGGRISHKKVWAEYVSIFYPPNSAADGDWKVELREINRDGELELCRDLTEAANDHDKPWREEFEKHFCELKDAN